MNKFKFLKENKVRIYETLLIVVAVLCLYFYKNNLDYRAQNLSMINESSLLKKNLDEINQKYIDIVNKIEVTEQDKIYLYNSLNGVLSDYSGLMQNYDTKLKEVGTLSKAVYYDDELLKKYSKYYFLNENYTPSSTIQINPEYTLNNKEIKILEEVKPKLENMIFSASSSDVKIIVHSGYRSFAEQKGLKPKPMASQNQINSQLIRDIANINSVPPLISLMAKAVYL
jgi:LAS superfamily LD-carboxypeptidase LdcB